MTDFLASWWSMIRAYFTASVAILSGDFGLLALLASIGTISLSVGVVLIVRKPERRALWLLVPLALASLTSGILTLANALLGWLGAGFAMLAVALLLLLLVAWIAYDADRRPPIWLVGIFIFCFAIYAGFVGVAMALTIG